MKSQKQVKNSLISFALAGAMMSIFSAHAQNIQISGAAKGQIVKPLSKLKLSAPTEGLWTVLDGAGDVYAYSEKASKDFEFVSGGSIGTHKVQFKDSKTGKINQTTFDYDAHTALTESEGVMQSLFSQIQYTLLEGEGSKDQCKYNGRLFYTSNSWFQDNLHTFRGLKYFNGYSRDYVDLFALSQAPNGMIYDNYKHSIKSHKSWLTRFGPEFVTTPNPETDDSYFVRIPVENMGEFSFLEAVYMVWKATGDDAWMKSRLDNCLKAIQYTTTDKLRWSDKFQLTKRGYTIDVWDFKCDEDNIPYNGDIMKIDLEKGRFGIHFGDNLGMAVGCEYVSEMLAYAGRNVEAEKVSKLAKEWRTKIDALAWNGNFYTHWIAEDPSIKRDFGGTDESKIVSLSNTWVLNRRISHDKAVAILKTYLRIKDEMPKSSPGEWYLAYPPFNKGWNDKKWQYMNGGVSPIAGGQIARAAFEHGYESYGYDILKRIEALAKKSNGRIEATYRGSMDDERPKATFTSLSLVSVANASYSGTQTFAGVNPWIGEGDNDLSEAPTGRVEFHEVPFVIPTAAESKGKQALVMWNNPKYSMQSTLPVNKKAGSIYIYHTSSGGEFAGTVKVNYTDGSSDGYPMIIGKHVEGWWFSPKAKPARYAWQGKNAKSLDIATYLYGFDVNPDKVIQSITFKGSENKEKWMILGITLSDQKVEYKPELISYGIPNNWAAGEVMYGLAEGLIGIKEDGIAFDKLVVSPRWSAAGQEWADATLRLEASKGYASYKYKKTDKCIQVLYTSNAGSTKMQVLLPKGKTVSGVRVNGKDQKFSTITVEQSVYATFDLQGKGVYSTELVLN